MAKDEADTRRHGANDRPRATVVVPAYNAAWVVEDTILSLRHQSVENIEIIVVDDGSKDNLAEVLAPHLAADSRLRLIRQENGGVARARNHGLAEARADYVGFLDADDIWHPQFIERTLAALEANPDAPYAFSYFFRFDANNRLMGWPMWPTPPRHDFSGMLALNVVGNGSGIMARRDRVLAAGGYDPTLRDRKAQGGEDWKLYLLMAHEGAPILIEEPLVGYRVVEKGMSRGDPDQALRAVRAVIGDMRERFSDISERDLADGRVAMNGWLIPFFLRQRRYTKTLELFADSYLRHPLWFRNETLRTLHRVKLRTIWLGLQYRLGLRRSTRMPLSEVAEQDGAHPYAYLPVANRLDTTPAEPAPRRRRRTG